MKTLATIAALALLLLANAATAQPPQFNVYLAQSQGMYRYNTSTSALTKIWPAANQSAQAVTAMLSPDGKQLAVEASGNVLWIMNNDGTNAHQVTGMVFNTANSHNFAFTTNGIFWVTNNWAAYADTLHRYNLQTGTMQSYPPYHRGTDATTFGGLHASADGTRMWTWVESVSPYGEPFIHFNNGDFNTPVVEYHTFWGHANMMTPDGRYSLGIGWDYTTNPYTHPFLWTWDWNADTTGPTYRHGVGIEPLIDDFRALTPIVNSSDWIMLAGPGADANHQVYYAWKFAVQAPTPLTISSAGVPCCSWMGALPNPLAWQTTETSITLTDTAKTGALHITGWTDAANPSVQSSKTWNGTPVITRAGGNVTISFTVATAPAAADTAVITLKDASLSTQLSRIIWTPKQSAAQKLSITTTLTDTAIILSWTNTLGSQYSFAVAESTTTGWGLRQPATNRYVDRTPVQGTNTYRVYAIATTDTSFQVVTTDYSAPPSITITAPTKGQTFTPGSTITVHWTAVNVGSVLIAISVNGGRTDSVLNDQGSIALGSELWSNYQITLPTSRISSIVVRVSAYNMPGISNQVAISTAGSGVIRGVRSAGAVSDVKQSLWFDLSGRALKMQDRTKKASLLVQTKGRDGMVKMKTIIK